MDSNEIQLKEQKEYRVKNRVFFKKITVAKFIFKNDGYLIFF